MTLSLREDWRKILRYAWSVRFLVMAGALSGAEVALPMIQPYVPLPPGLLAGLSAVATCAAFVARIVAQKQFSQE